MSSSAPSFPCTPWFRSVRYLYPPCRMSSLPSRHVAWSRESADFLVWVFPEEKRLCHSNNLVCLRSCPKFILIPQLCRLLDVF